MNYTKYNKIKQNTLRNVQLQHIKCSQKMLLSSVKELAEKDEKKPDIDDMMNEVQEEIEEK